MDLQELREKQFAVKEEIVLIFVFFF